MPPASMFATLRACLLAGFALTAVACDGPNPAEPISTDDALSAPAAATPAPSFANGFAGGIPFGLMRQPNTAFTALYTGAKQTVGPSYILRSLSETKARGGRVFLMLADHEDFYKDDQGHFSFSKWKARIDRYKHIDITPYINDGTIVGHFMIDEPQDKTNWNGVPLTGAQMEAMAEYSKQLWPKMVTVVRAPPGKIKWSGRYRYLDAAWAQVENVRGTLNVNDFINQNVANARSLGLQLVVGLNVTKGNLNRTRMTASQIKSWGSILLNDSYPCAFLSWMYEESYLAQADIKEAMRTLAEKAQNRPSKSCGGSSATTPVIEPELPEPPAPPEPTVPEPTIPEPTIPEPTIPEPTIPEPTVPAVIQLGATGWSAQNRHYARLTWSGATGAMVDVYRNGVRIRTTSNDGHDISGTDVQAAATYVFKVCERSTSKCSDDATVVLTTQPASPGTTPPPPPPPSSISLNVRHWASTSGRYLRLTWSGAKGSLVDVYRDGVRIKRTQNDGHDVSYGDSRSASYAMKVCESGTSNCSDAVIGSALK